MKIVSDLFKGHDVFFGPHDLLVPFLLFLGHSYLLCSGNRAEVSNRRSKLKLPIIQPQPLV
jgi:hypothetical protein